jgi:putative glutamine amidotransferase
LGERQQSALSAVRRRTDHDFVTVATPVAVTAPRRLVEGRERVTLNTAYVRALESAGLVPLAVPTMLAPDRAGAALAAVRGLVLTGGEDVAPDRYGAAPHPRLGHVDPVRDAAELALIAAARTRRLPILAICRGIQILNVALGGTLYQDLDTERPGSVPHAGDLSRHAVRVQEGSLLERTLGTRSATVNSRHHQAIRDLAPGLKAVAWADDGVIEAAEPLDAGAPWTVAVQWHPEDLTERALFDGFARAVS